MKLFDDLSAFIWRDARENNANTFFIDGDRKLLIDPGHRHLFGHVRKALAALSCTPNDINAVVATHGHPDHFEAAGLLKNALFGLGREEYDFLRRLAGNHPGIPEPAFFLGEGELTIGGNSLQVIPSPGHSPGSVCLYWPERKVLICGDVVFSRGIGRTDLPGGSADALKESITALSALDVEYLLPGHGDIVKGKDAVAENFRFIREYWFRHLS